MDRDFAALTLDYELAEPMANPRRGAIFPMRHRSRSELMRVALIVSMLLLVAGCGPRQPRSRELRMLSASYTFSIEPNPSPPHAREGVLYKVVVRDRESRQPIESGEGQIYASNAEDARTWDGFVKGAELGTYYGKLNYVTSGLWAVAIRFRRDSLHRLETVEWMQEVYSERDTPIP